MNIGIVGSGSIVERFIDSACQNSVNIHAIYSRNTKSDRIDYMVNKYSIEKVYDDYEAMLADSAINFIYVASPNSMHYGYSLKALNGGKNVICEKPFTSTQAEVKHLYEVATANHLMIFEAIVNIHMPNYKLVKELLPKLGTIKGVQLNYSQYSSRYDAFRSGQMPNVFNTEFSGGALMDINIYNVHFTAGLFGLPQRFKYYANIAKGIDTSGIAILEYPGFFASLTGAKDAESNNFAIIQGEEGALYIGNGSNGCEYLELKLNSEHRSIKYNEQVQTNELFYDRFKALCEYSIEIIGLVEQLRKGAGIEFAADTLG